MANIFTPTSPATGPWYIDREDCIGDSLSYINANTNYFGSQIQNLNTNLTNSVNALSAAIPPFPPSSITYITPDTEVNLIIDTSSLGATVTRLQEMFTRYLPSILLPNYGNNTTLYNQRVKQILYGDERTFSADGIARGGTSTSITNVVNIMFQDEANNSYHPWSEASFFPTSPRTADFNTDINVLRNLIDGNSSNYFRFLVFAVTVSNDLGRRNFSDFLFSVLNGAGNYSGTSGLSDKKNICRFSYNTFHDYPPSYYAELLQQAFINL
jgi:hypothetical protein